MSPLDIGVLGVMALITAIIITLRHNEIQLSPAFVAIGALGWFANGLLLCNRIQALGLTHWLYPASAVACFASAFCHIGYVVIRTTRRHKMDDDERDSRRAAAWIVWAALVACLIIGLVVLANYGR